MIGGSSRAARRPTPEGGVAVEVSADRIVGWVTRFGARNGGIRDIEATPDAVTVTSGDGGTAVLVPPFGPMTVGGREPLEALLDHVAALGDLGILLVRGGAHSVGVARAGVVTGSSTERPYLSGRTAAGGWSQSRYARRRGNQLTHSLDKAAATAARLLVPVVPGLDGLAVGGDRAALATVLADARLLALRDLPRRSFPDIPEPRRAVLDAIAVRALDVPITITPAR